MLREMETTMSNKNRDRDIDPNDPQGVQSEQPKDDRVPTGGNAGGAQNKNMPGQGARRGDQGNPGKPGKR
jgi:hypothetical protein